MTTKKNDPAPTDDAQVGTHVGIENTPQTGDAQKALDEKADRERDAEKQAKQAAKKAKPDESSS